MTLPQGANATVLSGKQNQLCRLTKSLYGLKQVSKQWYEKLTSFLHNINFSQSKTYSPLFIKNLNKSIIFRLIYVDDIILVGDEMTSISNVKAALNAAFKIKDLGQLRYFLGLEIVRPYEGIHIC